MNEITDVRIPEPARVELLRRLVSAQEDERRRIARDLHDRMGQLLAALSMGLQSLMSTDGITPAVRKQAQYLQALADDVSREVHDLTLELRPATLDDLGLSAALSQYLDLWSTRSKMEADIHVMGMDAGRLAVDLETTIYRIVQEALTNIAKHAHAHHVSVIVSRQPEQFSLIVEDDGVGFQLDGPWDVSAANGRLGLLGMQERLAAFGGTLEIESSLSHGTTLFVRVPLSITQKQPAL